MTLIRLWCIQNKMLPGLEKWKNIPTDILLVYSGFQSSRDQYPYDHHEGWMQSSSLWHRKSCYLLRPPHQECGLWRFLEEKLLELMEGILVWQKIATILLKYAQRFIVYSYNVVLLTGWYVFHPELWWWCDLQGKATCYKWWLTVWSCIDSGIWEFFEAIRLDNIYVTLKNLEALPYHEGGGIDAINCL